MTREFSFKWSQVAPDCPAIKYQILANNCGSCPTTTTALTTKCTNARIDGSTCTFALKTIVCGNISGNYSSHDVHGRMKGDLRAKHE